MRESFDRAKRADFSREFYRILLASDPAIRAKFARTDFEKQRDLLVHGVYSMLDYAAGTSVGKLAMTRLTKRHGPDDLDVSPAMYLRWFAAFLAALRLTDPNFDDALERQWRDALEPALRLLGMPTDT